MVGTDMPTPVISFPAELPITGRRADIAKAITDHQVVIVAGETGSGKTTQLPKICLDIGRGTGGMIGHTQPRRIATRTVAERIAEELGSELGGQVGYQIRFTERFDERTVIKVMTDGILLNEMQRDRALRRYDTIIIDEAHERSLNIDFILGYLRQLLPRRPDLKVIITSATIDPERFSRHFGGAPVIEVSGRTYPVEVRYREPTSDEGRDQPAAIVEAVQELIREGPGDILVFLSGEREIRDAADALESARPRRAVDEFDVLPLFARLSVADQHRVFAAHHRRRVVLATNVAETSLTVPGIRYVVDTGFARISRYSARTKVQRLPIEPISQASARQRAGRCGRVAAGVCIRLYTEEDFDTRPEFTDPEVVRTNLASVILQMTSLRLGRVEDFPFMDPPQARSIAAGVQLLQELGALSSRRGGDMQLTKVGRRLARIPIDPRLGRMILAAADHHCVREVCVLAAALSIQDPRERPADREQQADAAHRRFADPDSDFGTWLNLWRHLRTEQKSRSSNQFRKMCRESYLNYLRVREWQDLDAQLRRVAKSLHLALNDDPGAPDAVHQSLMAGLLSHLGMRDPERRDYVGARNTRFAIFPGSGLFRKQPAWVMSAELVETSRLWGRINARVEPEWAERIGADLVNRTYSEPHWEKNRAAVMAFERVTLYGLPIVVGRKVGYGGIDPEVSRELFIRHALVEGDWDTRADFFHHNQRLLVEAAELEDRARRRGIVVDDETLFDFYNARIPPGVVSGRHFDAWWKKQRETDPELLTFTADLVVNEAADHIDLSSYPDVWRHDRSSFDLSYRFEPGARDDGVTVDIPAVTLAELDPVDFTWPVPGLREELVTALLRSLPKAIRVHVIPAPDHAREFLGQAAPGHEALLDALERYVRRTSGVVVTRAAWNLEKVPPHLRWSYRIVDDAGRVLGAGKDLGALRRQFLPAAASAIAAAGHAVERDDVRDFEPLPESFVQTRAGHEVRGYPAYTVVADRVAVRVFSTAAEQAAAMRAGLRRLVIDHTRSPVPAYLRSVDNTRKLALALAPHPTVNGVLADCYGCVVDRLMDASGGPPATVDGFRALVDRVDAQSAQLLTEVLDVVVPILQASYQVGRRLSGRADLSLLPALTDMKRQHAGLVFDGFVTATGWNHLHDLSRYLAAVDRRLDLLPGNVDRDSAAMAEVHVVETAYEHRVAALPPGHEPGPELREVRWMIEELRVSLFAQTLGTARPVSVQRIERRLAAT
jgi:ATP-dependent helicase HrpA